MRQKRYGEFVLTDAVRPGPGVPVVPAEGYRLSRFRDAETQICLPVLGASVSAEKLFDGHWCGGVEPWPYNRSQFLA